MEKGGAIRVPLMNLGPGSETHMEPENRVVEENRLSRSMFRFHVGLHPVVQRSTGASGTGRSVSEFHDVPCHVQE